jgi:tripartite-type tricarboxylate transporter receptor subunit TctC
MTSSISRRAALQAAAASLASIAAPGALREALAQSPWPSRPIKMLVGTPPGDSSDASARQLAARLQTSLGQALVVENKPGAHGAIVGEAAKNAAKDGYTLLISSGGQMAINPSMYKKLPFDPMRDFTPIAQINNGFLYLAVNTSLPIHNLKEFVAYVKERPGAVNYGSGGSGTTQHLTMELLKKRTGLDIKHVPYRGSPQVLQDLIGGQIAAAFDAGGSILPQARNGKVRLIGVTSPQRLANTPDLPTFAEQGLAGFESRVWSGLFAPAGVPADIIRRLNEAVNQILQMPDYIAFLRNGGSEPAGGSSADFARFVQAEIAKWAVVVQESGAQVD